MGRGWDRKRRLAKGGVRRVRRAGTARAPTRLAWAAQGGGNANGCGLLSAREAALEAREGGGSGRESFRSGALRWPMARRGGCRGVRLRC